MWMLGFQIQGPVFPWHTVHSSSQPISLVSCSRTDLDKLIDRFYSVLSEWLANITGDYCVGGGASQGKTFPPLKEGHDEGQAWGKLCHFKIWAAKPESTWGYHDTVRNLGRVMPAISISEAWADTVCNLFHRVCSEELWSHRSYCASQPQGPFVLESFGDVKSIWGS